MRKATGTNTVSLELVARFKSEVAKHIALMNKALSGETLFGNKIQMPTRNLNDIKAEFIVKSTVLLNNEGLAKARGKSISKYVFDTALEDTMIELGL
jgi:hypothetical protein